MRPRGSYKVRGLKEVSIKGERLAGRANMNRHLKALGEDDSSPTQ